MCIYVGANEYQPMSGICQIVCPSSGCRKSVIIIVCSLPSQLLGKANIYIFFVKRLSSFDACERVDWLKMVK